MEACAEYSFFALQNNGWCVCGNAHGTEDQYAQVDDGQCGATCAGDDQLCGAGWRNAVYSTGRPQPIEFRPYSYVGCFVDDGSRDLQEGPMQYGYTSHTCEVACHEYSFFALQNNGWCVCGNAHGTASQYALVDDGQCGANCAGDDQLCGAGWRNAVYSTGRPQPIELRPYSYVGCFVDDGSRDLQEGPMAYGYTSHTCEVACNAYSFFALQNNGWCVCGNAYGTASQYAQVDNNQCGANCADDDQLCGAGWRNAVYSTGRPQPVEFRSYQYVGCFVDDGSRDLQQGPMAYGHTSASCMDACSDYSYFALQNNGWCVCGNSYSSDVQYTQVNNNQCGANCAGYDQLCGAGWRNAVYSTGREPPMEFLGCYVDDGSRDLQDGPRQYGYTSESCKQTCSSYSYFALQNNGCAFAATTMPVSPSIPVSATINADLSVQVKMAFLPRGTAVLVGAMPFTGFDIPCRSAADGSEGLAEMAAPSFIKV